ILERAASAKVSEMKQGENPDNDERKQHRRADPEGALEIFAKSHGSERDRRGKTDRDGNHASHETEGWVVNLGEKMIFAPGTRERRAQFRVTKRAAKRCDSTDDPEHEQYESRMNLRQLKAEARANARADDIGNHDGACRNETNRPSRRWPLHAAISNSTGHA